MRNSLWITCLLVLVATCTITRGDSIEFVNGDVMKGKVVSLDDKTLKFESDVIGVISIARAKIARIHLGDVKPTKPIVPPPTKPTPNIPDKPIPNKPITTTPTPTVTTNTPNIMSTDAIRQHNWLQFSKGAYCKTERSRFDARSIYPTATNIVLFHGHKDRKPVTQNFALIDKQWQPINAPKPWMHDAENIQTITSIHKNLGTKSLQVSNQPMNCTGTAYTIEPQANSPTALTVELWRNKTLNLPTQTLIVPGYKIAMPNDIVLIKVTGTHRSVKVKMDWTLKEINAQKKIAGQTIPVHIYLGNSSNDTLRGKSVGIHEKWMSDRVPGGVAYISESMRTGSTVAKTVIKVVGFGKTPPPGAPELK
jgi:hypothetical protein